MERPRPIGRNEYLAGVPRYQRLRCARRVLCDDCVLLLSQNNWAGPAPLPAGWERKTTAGRLRLCHPHMTAWMKADRAGRETR